MKKINVAVAGLGFGKSFVPIYLDHPNIEKLGVFDIDKSKADKVKEEYPDVVVYNSFEDIACL